MAPHFALQWTTSPWRDNTVNHIAIGINFLYHGQQPEWPLRMLKGILFKGSGLMKKLVEEWSSSVILRN